MTEKLSHVDKYKETEEYIPKQTNGNNKKYTGKSPEKDFYGAEISNLPDKEFK